MWEAFLRNDFESALSAFAADVEWDGTNLPDGVVARGHEAVFDHIGKWADMWDTWEVELEDVIDAGHGQVVVFIREVGRMKNGLEVNARHSELLDPAQLLDVVLRHRPRVSRGLLRFPM